MTDSDSDSDSEDRVSVTHFDMNGSTYLQSLPAGFYRLYGQVFPLGHRDGSPYGWKRFHCVTDGVYVYHDP